MDLYYVIGIPIVALVVTACMLPGFRLRAKMRRVKERYPTAPVTILESEKYYHDDGDFDYYGIKLEYTVNGNTYVRETKWHQAGLPGPEAFEVHYNPDNPEEAYPDSEIRGSVGAVILGAIISVVVIVAYLYRFQP